MDKTYYYLYKKLYRHFFKFCIAGSASSKDAIKIMEEDVNNTKDFYLINIYQIIRCIDPADNTKFLQKSIDLEKILTDDDYENLWCLHSILYLVYQYVYPDYILAKKSKKIIDFAGNELKNAGVFDWKIEFEEADYAIQMHIDKNNIVKDAYGSEFSKRDFRLQNRSFITILKGFSSSTPFFYPALRERFHNVPIKGGGFFLKWKGYGVVIDPGISFMENMHIAGLNINDINAIFVTHNHIDHNGDLSTIDDLASQFGKKDIVLYVDKDTEREYVGRLVNISKKNRHGIDFGIMGKSSEITIGDEKNIQVEFMPTKHIIEDGKYLEETTYALKLSLKEAGTIRSVIGFTSDTIYLKEFTDFFTNCDYVIANISETNKEDYLKIKPKDTHLGYCGCLQLIKNCRVGETTGKTKFIISEFWAGKGDVRKELVRALRKETGYEYIYPGDIGMLFFLDQPTFLCGYCGKEEMIENLNIIKPGLEYSRFANVCDECILS